MNRWPVSIWSGYFSDLSCEEMVDKFIEHGFYATEFSVEHGVESMEKAKASGSLNAYEKEGLKLRKLFADRDFYVPQGHLEFHFDITLPETRDLLKRQIEMYLGIGIRNMVLHATGDKETDPEGFPRYERLVAALNELAPSVKGTDAKLCLENLGSSKYACSSEKLLKLIGDTDDPEAFGICLDTGHLNLNTHNGFFPETQAGFVENAGNRLLALHIAGNMGEYDDHLMPFNGKQKNAPNWVSLMRALRSSSYDGLFNFEIPGERCPSLAVRLIKLDYVKKIANFMQDESFLFQ